MNTLDFIICYETGELSDEELIKGFQELIDTGLIHQLQGCYGRMAERLIQAGYCHRRGESDHDTESLNN